MLRILSKSNCSSNSDRLAPCAGQSFGGFAMQLCLHFILSPQSFIFTVESVACCQTSNKPQYRTSKMLP